MKILISVMLGLMLSISASAGDFILKSPAFENNARMPHVYTCDGDNASPPLSWDNAPPETKSFVLIFMTRDWESTNVYFWTLYNIPVEVKSLEQGNSSYPEGTLVGMNYLADPSYHGPCPPDEKVHKYVFTLYALDDLLYPVEDEIDPEDLLVRIKPHVLKQVQLTVFYSH